MRFGGHSNSTVSDTGGQLSQCVSGAGGNNEQIQQSFGSNWLYLFNAVPDGVAAERFKLMAQLCVAAKPAVSVSALLGKDRDQLTGLSRKGLQRLKHCLMGTVRTAKGKANGSVTEFHSSSSCII